MTRLALGASARTTAVSAVAVHEPPVFEMLDEETGGLFEHAIGSAAAAATEGKLVEAARIFGEFVANDDELAELSDSAYFEEAARYMPTFLAELEQEAQADQPSPTDPSALATITAPVLLLHGSRSAQRQFFTAGVRHVAEHVPDTRVRELADSGHWAVALALESVADELVRFFLRAPEPA